MTRYGDIETRANAAALAVMGAFHPTAEDGAPADCGTLVLLGPGEPGFWQTFTASPEATDGQPNPLDRWSRRVIDGLAGAFSATALYPFSGPPWQPFISWAQRSGRTWISPVGLLVHDTAGLMVSFRGALAISARLDLPPTPRQCPCEGCDQPCCSGCPVSALDGARYDTAACHGFLDTAKGADCMTRGCAVRRACPVSQRYGRQPAQSAFHMRSFHPCP